MTLEPSFARLVPLLESMRTWVRTLGPLPARPVTHRSMARWIVTPNGVNFAWEHGFGPKTGHEAIQAESDVTAFNQTLFALCQASGMLDVGMRTITLDATQAARNVLFKGTLSGAYITDTDIGISPATLCEKLQTCVTLLRKVPFTKGFAKAYEVERKPIMAPDPKAAIALYLMAENPDRLARILNTGPHQGGMSRLSVTEVITRDGESLFST